MTALFLAGPAFAIVAVVLALVSLWYTRKWQRSLARLQGSLSQWTTAIELQAAEMKHWHQDLVGRETALRGPEGGV